MQFAYSNIIKQSEYHISFPAFPGPNTFIRPINGLSVIAFTTGKVLYQPAYLFNYVLSLFLSLWLFFAQRSKELSRNTLTLWQDVISRSACMLGDICTVIHWKLSFIPWKCTACYERKLCFGTCWWQNRSVRLKKDQRLRLWPKKADVSHLYTRGVFTFYCYMWVKKSDGWKKSMERFTVGCFFRGVQEKQCRISAAFIILQ